MQHDCLERWGRPRWPGFDAHTVQSYFVHFLQKKKSYRLKIARLSYLTCIRMKASSEEGMKEEPQRAPQRKSTPIYAREGHGSVWKVMNQSLSFLTWYGGQRRENEFEPKMAGLERKLSGEGDELPRCSTLFVTEDGSQMNFYMTPCAMKTRLRPLIHVSLREALACDVRNSTLHVWVVFTIHSVEMCQSRSWNFTWLVLLEPIQSRLTLIILFLSWLFFGIRVFL